MRKKYILALRILAFGIALEVVLLASLLVDGPAKDQVPGAEQAQAGRSDSASLLPEQDGGALQGQVTFDDISSGALAFDTDEYGDDPYAANDLLDAMANDPLFQSLAESSQAGADLPPDSAPPLDSGYPAPNTEEWYTDSYDPSAYPPPDNPAPDANPSAPAPQPTQPLPVAPGPSAPADPTALPAPTAAPSPTMQTTQDLPPTAAPAQDAVSVSAVYTRSDPEVDGVPDDTSWQKAPKAVIQTGGGANASATSVTVQAAYNSKYVYFLFTWADPTHSWQRALWEKQSNGTWTRLADPENQGYDENRYEEDKLALLWPAGSVSGFVEYGCGSACHSGEQPGMVLPAAGALADLWVWKSTRAINQVEDMHLDDTRSGIKADPGKGGYTVNASPDGRQPAFMPRELVKDGYPGYIEADAKQPFDDRLFAPGDRVASALVAPFTGDRASLSAGWRYKDGLWTLEVSRRLVTGSAFDVQFDDLALTYPFALATFDRTTVRHAVQSGAAVLTFQPR